MKRKLAPEERKQLEKKIMAAFKDEIKTLSQELQKILADDMVTALQNRLATLIRIQSKHVD